jgi:hypothetical protein
VVLKDGLIIDDKMVEQVRASSYKKDLILDDKLVEQDRTSSYV